MLEHLLLAPPLPALLAALWGVAFLGLSGAVRRQLPDTWPGSDAWASAFILAVAGVAGLAHAACVVAGPGMGMARGLAVLVLVAGVGCALRWVPWKQGASAGLQWVRQHGPVGVAVAAGMAGWWVVALAPASDADSLDYHLGIPVWWLLGVDGTQDAGWMDGRLVGLGEFLNLLGVAVGTDALGAVLQWGALLVAVVVLEAHAKDTPWHGWMALALVSSPLMLGLIPSQKPMMLPVVASLLGFLHWNRQRLLHEPGRARLLASAVAFALACGCKHSFLVGAGVMAVAWSWELVASSRLASSGWAVGAAVLLPGQVWLRNLLQAQDPITPLLERLKAHPDPILLAYAQFLSTYEADRPLLQKVVALFVPVSGALGVALGVAGVWLVGVLWAARRDRGAWVAVGALVVLLMGGTQVLGRFLLEPALWAGLLVLGTQPPAWMGKPWRVLTSLQALAVGAALLVGMVRLGPGMLTPALRARTLERAAFGVSEARWLDQVLPPDAVFMTAMRTHAVFPRRTISTEAFLVHAFPTAQDGAAWLRAQGRHGGASHLVLEEGSALEAPLEGCVDKTPVATGQVSLATRNPLVQGAPIHVKVVAFQWDAESCPR